MEKNKNKILIAEDETDLAKALQKILEINSYSVSLAQNGKEALDILKENSFDVIVLDIMMPVMDGVTTLKNIRKIGLDTPIILLTAKSSTDDKVLGLDSGANDYITKPFETKELLARIRSLIRTKENETKEYCYGNIKFDKSLKAISNGMATLNLSNEESNLMEILIKNKENNMTEEQVTSILSNMSKEGEKENSESLNLYSSYLDAKLKALNSNINFEHSNFYKFSLFNEKNKGVI